MEAALILLITEINTLASATFSGYHTAPVIPKAAFTDLVDTLLRYNHTLMGCGYDGHGCAVWKCAGLITEIYSLASSPVISHVCMYIRGHVYTYEVIRTTNKQLG